MRTLWKAMRRRRGGRKEREFPWISRFPAAKLHSSSSNISYLYTLVPVVHSSHACMHRTAWASLTHTVPRLSPTGWSARSSAWGARPGGPGNLRNRNRELLFSVPNSKRNRFHETRFKQVRFPTSRFCCTLPRRIRVTDAATPPRQFIGESRTRRDKGTS